MPTSRTSWPVESGSTHPILNQPKGAGGIGLPSVEPDFDHQAKRRPRWLRATWAVPIALAILMSVPFVPAGSLHGIDARQRAPTGTNVAPALQVGSLGASDEWPTYLGSISRTSSNAQDRTISSTTAHDLVQLWSHSTGGPVASSPAVSNRTVYVGSWDGYEYALNAANGSMSWRTFVGLDTYCNYTTGVTSSATVLRGTVYVGGGDGRFYALNAYNGSVEWSVLVGNTSLGYYNWASPLIVHGAAYVGLASDCEQPPVPGGLLKIDLVRHAIVGRVDTTLNGSVGGGIWSSPAFDPVSDRIFVTTGNPGPNASPYTEAILAISPNPFRIVDHWQIPAAATVTDGDFGATPALFSNSTGAPMVAALNKNGYVYAWNRTDLARGPVWLDFAGSGVAPGAVGGGSYFVGTGGADVGGIHYAGSLRSYRLDDGQLTFAVGLSSPVIGAPIWTNGVVAFGAGSEFELRSATNGTLLASFVCPGRFLSAPSAAEGRLYAGCTKDVVLSWGLPLQARATVSPRIGPAPLKVTLDGIASSGVPSYRYAWSFGDGSPNSTAEATSHRYAAPGTYNATLTVVDQSGTTVQLVQTIQVSSPYVAPPRSSRSRLPQSVGR